MKAKNIGTEGGIDVVRHFTVVASFIVKFGASWGEFTVLTVVPTAVVENAQVQSTCLALK